MITTQMTDLLLKTGFDSGWVLSDEVLVLWEHEEEPPTPLTRPVAEKPAKTAK